VLFRDQIPEITDMRKNARRIGILASIGRVSGPGTARLVEIPADRHSVEPRDRRRKHATAGPVAAAALVASAAAVCSLGLSSGPALSFVGRAAWPAGTVAAPSPPRSCRRCAETPSR
jgi:hypothetical protein